MHYGRLVSDLIAHIKFGLRPNFGLSGKFGLRLWSQTKV